MQPQVSANERIAFFELLAQVVLFYLRIRHRPHTVGEVVLHHQCDNMGSVGAVAKFFPTKAPMCFGLQALAWHAGRASASVRITHIQGEKNILADQISRWRKYPEVISTLPRAGELTDFTLQEILGPVWHFAAIDNAP